MEQKPFAREEWKKGGEGVVIDGRRWLVSCEPLSRRTFRMRRRERFLSGAFIGTGALVKPKNGTTAIECAAKAEKRTIVNCFE